MPQQAVGIFIGPPLPGRIGIGKIDIQYQRRLDGFKLGKFTTIIHRQASAPLVGNRIKGLNRGVGKSLRPLAVLDAIMSPEWEDRYYSFNAAWAQNEEMGSMRNGSGDSFVILFDQSGCFIKGFDHACPMSSWANDNQEPWPGLLNTVPSEFSEALKEPAFSMKDISFCIWRLNSDQTWSIGDISFPTADDPDGSEYHLEHLDSNLASYQSFAESYYEEIISLVPIKHIYEHHPITDEIIKMLNPYLTIEDIKGDLIEIAYPIPIGAV